MPSSCTFDRAKLSLILKRLIVLMGIFQFQACATHESLASKTAIPSSVLESRLSPRELFEKADNFLEYQLGYSIRVRDLESGLLVTDWSRESAIERQQITLHTAKHETGSLVSAHIRSESLSSTGWQVLPTSGEKEAEFLKSFEDYISEKK